jgi:hypothetical protein
VHSWGSRCPVFKIRPSRFSGTCLWLVPLWGLGRAVGPSSVGLPFLVALPGHDVAPVGPRRGGWSATYRWPVGPLWSSISAGISFSVRVHRRQVLGGLTHEYYVAAWTAHRHHPESYFRASQGGRDPPARGCMHPRRMACLHSRDERAGRRL